MTLRRADSRANNADVVSGGGGRGELFKQIAVEVVLTAVSAALSFFILQAMAKHLPGSGIPSGKDLDPRRNADAARRRLKDSKTEQIKFNEYEDIIAGDMVFPDEIDATFEDVGGHERDKNEIYDLVCLPLKHPDVFSRLSTSELLSPPRGILLYGPPGTGKTMLAKAIAKESGAAFINLKMSTTMNLYFGESQKLVRATFSLAQKLAPCIIFIDEIDSFLRERKSDDNSALGNMKAEFMALWDGIESDKSGGAQQKFGIVVVGATNRPWDVDPAILRRMPRTFEIGLPDIAEREKILRLVLRSERVSPSVNLSKLAKHCNGYSGSDLKELCRAAAAIPYREFASKFRSGDGNEVELRYLEWSDFERAKESVRPAGETAGQYHEKVQSTKRSQSSQPDPSEAESFIAGVQYGMSLAANGQNRSASLHSNGENKGSRNGERERKPEDSEDVD